MQEVTSASNNGSASGTYTSSPPAGGASPRRGSQGWNRAARIADERLLPEHGSFLRSAPYLCHLPLPACPFSGGSRGAEPH